MISSPVLSTLTIITLALRVCQVIFGVRSALDFDQLGTIYSDLGAIERHGLLKRKRCE